LVYLRLFGFISVDMDTKMVIRDDGSQDKKMGL
jgi:hypothetical protein